MDYSQCDAIFQSKAHLAGKAHVAFSPNGEKVVTSGIDGIIKVWDVRRILARERFEEIDRR